MDNISFSKSPGKHSCGRLKILLFSPFIFFALFCSPHLGFSTGKEITPERDISVVRRAPQSPDWKILWDRARNLAREGRYDLAADEYGLLFSIKSNVEEANWEYCKVLLQIKSYKTASQIISLLLERNPTKNEYLLVAGQVAAEQKKYLEAEHYFGLIFEKAPVGQYGDAALEGFAYSLRARGHRELAFPLMQQLNLRQPYNKMVLHDFALDAVYLKRFDVARALYRQLLADENVADSILLEAVPVFAGQGFEEEHIDLLNRYLQLHPDYLPFHEKLLALYEQREEYDNLMEHLLFLIENSDEKKDYVLRAADVARNRLKRPDRALGYLEQIRATHPHDTTVIAAINELQGQLAHDFLAIVENGGADLLWADLDSMGANRQEIFHRMAVLLEKDNKFVPLIDVLEVLYHHGEQSEFTALKLARLHHSLEHYEQSQAYVVMVPVAIRSGSFYRLKADNEIHLGLEFDSFASLTKALEHAPEDQQLRIQCITLAGHLGLVEEQIELFNHTGVDAETPLDVKLTQAHVQSLLKNKIFDEALRVCDTSLQANYDASDHIQLYLLKVDVLRASGRVRAGEQLLRQLLTEELYQHIAMEQLLENAIADNKLQMARKWLDLIDSKQAHIENPRLEPGVKNRTRLAEIQLLRLEGKFVEALTLLEQVEQEIRNKKITAEVSFVQGLTKEKCRLFLADKKHSEVEKLLKAELQRDEFDADLFILYETVSAHDAGDDQLLQYLTRNNAVLFSRVLSVVEKELENQEIERAKRYFTFIENVSDRSVRLKNIAIQLALFDGDLMRAQHDVSLLEERYDKERYFCQQHIGILTKHGKYNEALNKYDHCFLREKSQAEAHSDTHRISVEEELLHARLLWGAKDYESSLEEYRTLLDPPVSEKLMQQFKEKRIDYQNLTRHQSIWSSLMVLIESDPDIVAELMEPRFLFDNIGNETGKIVSQNFEQYSWQEIIKNEFLARKASFNKNYHFAVKSYEKLLEKEETTESKVDLAAIYGRIGKYRKEAQVYEDISNVGEVTPELQKSISQNILQIRPTNTIDSVLEERNGRQGTVDIRKKSIGSTFWFTPDLNKDFWLSYSYNQYESTEGQKEIDSNMILGAMTYELSGNYELITGLGAEKLNDSNDSEIRYNFELKGQLDDYVSGFILYEKAPITDTVEAIKEEIYRQYIQTGLTIETELGVTFGGDLRYSVYDDDNEQKRFNWFSSYSIFGETLQLDVRYAYQYLINKDVNVPENQMIVDTYDNFIEDYWSPEKFSEHRLGLQLKKDFFGSLTEVENKMSYFRFDTGVSLEDEENIAYSAQFDIFLEMSPHMLLKGNFSFSSSDVYDEKMLSLSLHYSW